MKFIPSLVYAVFAEEILKGIKEVNQMDWDEMVEKASREAYDLLNSGKFRA